MPRSKTHGHKGQITTTPVDTTYVVAQLERAKKRAGATTIDIHINGVHQDGPFTMVLLGTNVEKHLNGNGGVGITAPGTSKCSPQDTYDSQIGVTIAIFRAVRNLKAKVIEHGSK